MANDHMDWITRCGLGYDIHRLVPGRRLVLGGLDIPYPRGLDGHSDADVIAHAIGDALLGALALGDLGRHFPPDDATFKDMAGTEILRRIAALVAERGAEIVHIDVTVLAEEPRLAPHLASMRERIGAALGIESDRVSIKATTHEGLDATGRGDAMAAHAIATVREPES